MRPISRALGGIVAALLVFCGGTEAGATARVAGLKPRPPFPGIKSFRRPDIQSFQRTEAGALAPAIANAHGQSTNDDPLRPTLERIEALIARNDLAAAKAATAAALKAHAADPLLNNFAGVVAAQQGDHVSAERYFQTAIRHDKRLTAAYLNLGRLYQERAVADAAASAKAVAIYRALLAVDPVNAEALYQAGFLLALNGDFADSRGLIERLPAQARERPQVLAVLAADLSGEGNGPAASAVASELAAHPDLTALDVRGVVPAFDRAPDRKVAYTLLEALDRRGLADNAALGHLAAFYARDNRFADARRLLERVAAAGATVPVLTDLARAAYRMGDQKGALGYLAHARELEPKNAAVHFFFGIVCVEQNLGAEAYDSLKKAVALAPDSAPINYAMGAVSMHRHEPSEALPYFEAYMRLAPEDPRGRFALGAALFYANQLEAARTALTAAARHTETAAGAHYFLARIARQLNDHDTALREVKAALDLNPKYADAWAELGLVQMRLEQYAEAQTSLDRALAIDPENHAAHVNLTALYGRTRDPRREAQAAKLAALQQKRAVQAQEFLRIVRVTP
jgi:tetratricopeptide (TPR) repeat protein